MHGVDGSNGTSPRVAAYRSRVTAAVPVDFPLADVGERLPLAATANSSDLAPDTLDRHEMLHAWRAGRSP